MTELALRSGNWFIHNGNWVIDTGDLDLFVPVS